MDSSITSKQLILRGFPSRGIPFPKQEDILRCNVCPYPKPIKRGLLSGSSNYGIERKKLATQVILEKGDNHHIHNMRGERSKARITNMTTKEKKKVDKNDEFVRHDGHFKQPQRSKIVTFLKQYQKKNQDFQALQQYDKIIDYGGDNDMNGLAHPCCGVNCYQTRQNVYKAVNELMSKRPEIIYIKQRIRPKEMLEMRTLMLHSSKKEEILKDNKYENLGEALCNLENAIPIISEELNKIDASTQTQTLPYFSAETTPSLNTPVVSSYSHFVNEIQDITSQLQLETLTRNPSDVSLFMEDPPLSSTTISETPTYNKRTTNETQPKITTLLFPQPRVTTPIYEDQVQSSCNQNEEWFQKEVSSVPIECSSSFDNNKMMQNIRGRQREKHWERERVNSAIIYQELLDKVKVSNAQGSKKNFDKEDADRMQRRKEEILGQRIGKKIIGEDIQKKILTYEFDEQEVETRLNHMLEHLNLEENINFDEETHEAMHIKEASGGIQDLLKSNEEHQYEKANAQREQQQRPLYNRSVSPTELEYMKTAILNHSFYARLVSSFIKQHAAGASPETMAKLKKVRNRAMQSWNPSNSVECDEKIRKYQKILTEFESDLEKPFQEAMDFSFTLENMFQFPSQAQKRKHDGEYMKEVDDEEEHRAMFS